MKATFQEVPVRGAKVLVSGITGFLGSRLAKALVSAQATPIGLVRPGASQVELEKCGLAGRVKLFEMNNDLANIDAVIQAAVPDVIVHVASASRIKEDAAGIREMVSANILLPSLLFESMSRHSIRKLINIGSSWQSTDGSLYRPFNFYAATKQAVEDIVDHYSRNLGFSAVTLRLFDTYGPDDPRSKILNLIVKHTVSGVPLDMSPGNQKIHLVHIDDVSRAVIGLIERVLALTDEVHEKYDLISPRSVSLRELATMIGEIAGKPCPINWGGRSYRSGEIMEPTPSNPLPPHFAPLVELRSGVSQIMSEVAPL